MDDSPWFRHYEEGVPRTIPYPDLTLPDVLERFPDRVALRFFLDARLPAPALTYGELREQTLRFATALFQLGVRKGDRVALMLPNCPQQVVAFYGTLRLGAIPVNTNPMYVSREMRERCASSSRTRAARRSSCSTSSTRGCARSTPRRGCDGRSWST